MCRERDDQDKVLGLIKDKLYMIKIYQRFLMLNSTSFPYPNFEGIQAKIEEVNVAYPEKFKKEKHKLTRA